MFSPLHFLLGATFAVRTASAINFAYESVQLQDSDIGNNKDIAFGDPATAIDKTRCKRFPGDSDWPSDEKWSTFNSTLEGALVKGVPPAAFCYNGTYFDAAKCAEARRGLSNSIYTGNDPLIPNAPWQLGNPCPLPPVPFPGSNVTQPTYTCNITSYPAYVVNATTVKHIQLAVNFARNNNIRVTIKNTGHDFVGRGTGGGALQVWTHNLKPFEFLPTLKIGEYQGRAARVGAGLQQWELFPFMEQYNITMLAPGSSTVGAYGGYMQGGGFSYLTSKYGLMADQILSLEVVTADGRFVHADPEENTDLFFAIRGGGPSNFGIVTSAVVKAYDSVYISETTFNLQTNAVIGNVTDTVRVADLDLFWKGVAIYFSYLPRVTDVGGSGWNNLGGRGSGQTRSFSLTARYTLPGLQQAEAKEFLTPLFRQLQDAGINITVQTPKFYETYPKQAFRPNGPGEGAGGGRFGSRLIPRENLLDINSDKFKKTIASFRSLIEEGGYSFHSVDFTPTRKVAGYPGSSNAVNPALRNAIMHVTSFDTGSYGPDTTPAQQIASHARLNSYIQKLRDATPGSGAYMNEADTEEPNFQQSFFGDNYKRLLSIKRATDPWSLFYAVTQVGSEDWTVEDTHGLPTQQGRLCRVSA